MRQSMKEIEEGYDPGKQRGVRRGVSDCGLRERAGANENTDEQCDESQLWTARRQELESGKEHLVLNHNRYLPWHC